VDLAETAQVPETDEIEKRGPKKLLEAKTNFKVQQRACSVLGWQNPVELMKHKDLAFSVSRYAANIARHAAYWAKLVAESAVIAARKLCWQPTTQSAIRQVEMFRELELRYQCVGHGTGRDEAAVIREQAYEYRQWQSARNWKVQTQHQRQATVQQMEQQAARNSKVLDQRRRFSRMLVNRSSIDIAIAKKAVKTAKAADKAAKEVKAATAAKAAKAAMAATPHQ
jgi:hypothetical protein